MIVYLKAEYLLNELAAGNSLNGPFRGMATSFERIFSNEEAAERFKELLEDALARAS